MERDWRKKLATLLASLERIWGLKTTPFKVITLGSF